MMATVAEKNAGVWPAYKAKRPLQLQFGTTTYSEYVCICLHVYLYVYVYTYIDIYIHLMYRVHV